MIAPLACFAIFPVSRVSVRPPTSTVTRRGAGVSVFSDMNRFLCLRIRAEHLQARSRGKRALSLRWPQCSHPWGRVRGESDRKADETRRTTPREIPALTQPEA